MKHLLLIFNYSLLLIFLASCTERKENNYQRPSTVNYSDLAIEGELLTRIHKNFDRLEEPKYQPQNVFLTEEESGNWPGDTEGRTILALVLNAQASHRAPVYLDKIIELLPGYLNEQGYMGPVYENKMSEQQLSGNGWMLRGLCEYYEWKKDESIVEIISSIANHLFVKGKGTYASYPIDLDSRDTNVGAEAGTIQKENNGWLLSSDIGCIFIGMDGLVHAYQYLRTPEIKEVIEEMIDRFLEIDLIGIKAQTHASLSACRALVRYAEITGEDKYIEEAIKRWKIYKSDGMTENHENYNWFDRFDTWTEPCAIIDSYLLAVQLWQHTEDPVYREEAELIYYNAICHTQRHNGGFGCDNCPGNAIHDVCLKVHADEAHWCCTMRGGEGLSSAARYAWFTKSATVYIPFYHSGKLTISQDAVPGLSIEQQTNYPFGGKVQLRIEENTQGRITLKLAIPSFTYNHKIIVNGKEVSFSIDKGFATITRDFKQEDTVELVFEQQLRKVPAFNKENTNPDQFLIYYGPLLLGVENEKVFKLDKNDSIIPVGEMKFKIKDKDIFLTPVYHLMDRKVWLDSVYKKQILF